MADRYAPAREQLYKLPRGAPLRVLVDGKPTEATFHRLDGSYTVCTTNADQPEIFHLKAWTPMVEVNGRWEIEE